MRYKTLGEVCKIYNGNSINADYKKKHFLGATGGLPFIATKDVSPLGTIDYNNGVRIPNYEEYKVAPANSVFICAEGGSAGKKFAYVEKDVCFGNKLFCITPKDKAIKGKFIYHFVQSDNFRGQFFSLLTGLIGGVSAKKFQTIEIPVPSLSEQQSIVDYLDSAFAKIDAMKANAEKALNEAKALFQASLKEMLEPKEGWEEKKLKEVVASITDGDHQPPPKSDDGIPFITISNIDKNSNKIVFGETFYVPQSYYCALKKDRIPQQGDVLYTVTGSFGIPVLVDFQKEFCFQRHIALIRPNMGLLSSTYLFYWILSSYATSQAEDTATGAAQRTVSLNSLRNFTINFPPLSEQQSIVATLDSLKSKVDRLQANYDKISQECDALKQAILRQVFE